MPTLLPANERRVFERFSTRYPARFKDSRNDYGTEVFLRDASATGARIVSNERFFLNDHVAIEVELPDGKSPLSLQGTVTWIKPLNPTTWDVGMEFPAVNFMKVRRLFQFSE